MRSTKKLIGALCFGILSLVLTARLSAVTDSNTQCNASGGCSTPCSGGSGGSSKIISASQLPQCSPQAMSSCSGSTQAVCGVVYTYSSGNCDPTTITDSQYTYSNCCTP
jgi:hypothetical protein